MHLESTRKNPKESERLKDDEFDSSFEASSLVHPPWCRSAQKDGKQKNESH